MKKLIIITILIFLFSCNVQVCFKTATKDDGDIYTLLNFEVQGDKILSLKETIRLSKDVFDKNDLLDNLKFYQYDEDELYHYLICVYDMNDSEYGYTSFKKTKYNFTRIGYDFGY